MKLVIADPVWLGYAERLARQLEPQWEVGCLEPPLLPQEVAGADAILSLELPAGLLPAAHRLKLFQFPGAGVQHFTASQFPAGCKLCNVYEHEIPIAEYAIGVMLMHVTKVVEHWKTFAAGRWHGSGRTGGRPHGELFGKTVGVIGFGRIGRAVTLRAKAFGMKVIAISERGSLGPPAHPVPDSLGGPGGLHALLAASDFVVVACPLTATTLGMLGVDELACMKRSSMLINVARAEIVVEKALFESLAECRIAAAALDVWYQYPDPMAATAHGSKYPFHELPNVVVTPHLSGWTTATVDRRIARIAENLNRLAAGLPLRNVVLTGMWRPDRVRCEPLREASDHEDLANPRP